jgi:phosphate:Na+ symporter
LESFFERDEDKANKVFENEKTVDFLHQGITDKLIEINNLSLSASDAERIGAMFGVLSGLERIGDYAENIAKYAIKVKDRDMKFTDAAIKELKALGEITTTIISTAFDMYENLNDSQLPQIETLRNKVDKLATALTKNHVKRLKSGKCKPRSGIVFIDIVNDLERSADHSEDIAKAVWAR